MTIMFVILAGAILGIALAVRVLYRAAHPDLVTLGLGSSLSEADQLLITDMIHEQLREMDIDVDGPMSWDLNVDFDFKEER